jgi:hypothetical protein
MTTVEAERLAGYLAKLGLEIVGEGKEGRRGAWNSWRIAHEAANGSELAIALWREFERATRGKRMLEMDDRASAAADRWVPPFEEPSEGSSEIVRVRLSRDEMAWLAVLERSRPAAIGQMLSELRTSMDPLACVRAWLSVARGARPPRNLCDND